MTEQARVLLIGGTEEAVEINQRLVAADNVLLITSLAGRTADPAELQGHVITGGFGGAAGLANFLEAHAVTHVIDATHPFAAEMTRAAFAVCAEHNRSYLRYQRPPWEPASGDHWIDAESIEGAASQLDGYNRIFLSIGRQELARFDGIADKYFLVRSIEDSGFKPEGSRADFIRARGPFALKDEIALLAAHKIDLLVSKNSGGEATYAKIAAARELRLPVLMIGRPPLPDCRPFEAVDAVISVFKEMA